MDKNVKRRNALFVLIAVFMVCILAVACTACSLFVSVLKKPVATQSSTTATKDGDTTASSNGNNSEQKPSSGGSQYVDLDEFEKQLEEEKEQDPEVDPPTEPTEPTEPTPPPEEPEKEEISHVVILSSLVYDKSSDEDMIIDASHENMTLAGTGLMGAGLTSSRYSVKTNNVGSSSFTLDKAYLSTLDVGNYDLYYIVQDTSSNVYYEPFVLEVTNTHCHPTDLKINYDINCRGSVSDVYITWNCDCNREHIVAFDKTAVKVDPGVREYKITENVNKTVPHTAQVRCYGAPETEVQVDKDMPANSVIEGSYLATTFRFMGRVADRYIEDFDELVFAYQYLAYEGADTSLRVALGPDVLDDIQDMGLQEYLTQVNGKLVVPWSLNIGFESQDNIATLRVQNVVGGNDCSSGYSSDIVYDRTKPTVHYHAQGSSRATLPIDTKTAVSVRNTKELLAVVEAGYKPNITDSTLSTLYNKARAVCSQYISEGMSDVQKLHVIYDYLAGEILYDDSTLELFTLLNTIRSMSLADAKSAIDAKLSGVCKFSASMRTVVQEACDDPLNNSTEKLFTALYNDYLQKLSAFSIEGVFNDKTAVCEGISDAFMLLARIEGIECYQVSGKAVQEHSLVNHAWNKVILDGKCYCIDATWGNISAFSGQRFISHRYFLLDEASFCDSHREETASGEYGVTTLATADYEYYKSVYIDEDEHTLYVSDDDDLVAVAEYYAGIGSYYLEMQIDPKYSKGDVIMTTLQNAYSSANMVFKSYSTVNSDNGVCSLYVTLEPKK